MSALTKIFVVLVVLLSIVMTAGTVVYVNRSQNFVAADKAQKAEIAREKARAAAAEANASMVGQERAAIQAAMQGEIDKLHGTIQAMQGSINERDTQIAQLNANLAQVNAAQKSATDALAVAQKTVDGQNATIADARKSLDDLTKKNAELSFAINDMTNKYEVVNRQERDDREQITQLQSDNRKYQETLHKNGISDNTSRNLTGESLVNVSGTVQSVQKIDGVPYATISIGAAQQVSKGMQFKVFDPKASDPFLGYLTVDRVEPNQAFGHLYGPHVNNVRPNEAEVRSQL